MDSRKYLTEQIRRCRRKMNIARLIDSGILFAAAGGIPGIVCEGISLILPFYHVRLAAGLCFAAGLLAGICHGVLRRADMSRAARRLDSFGLKERMITAWEQMDSDGEFALLQREDAFRHYERNRERIRIPLAPARRHLCALFLAVAATVGLSLIPSPVREQAQLRHEVQEIAGKEQERLKELLEAMEKIDMESLTEEQRAQLEELLEAMALSRQELEKAGNWESLAAALEKLDYKYGQTAQTLSSLAAPTSSPQTAGIAPARALALAAANRNGRQTASAGTASDGSQGGTDTGDGQSGSGADTGDGQSGGQGQGTGDGQGDGQGQGAGDGQGQGDGDGQGQGDGDGQGQGDGSGDGTAGENAGSGNASGRGTGSDNARHDYVSVSNAVGDDPALTGDKNGDQDSEYYRRQNGLAWEGKHVDYGAVIGEYTDNAYEGIAAGRYPSGMEPVIRDYFESLNRQE